MQTATATATNQQVIQPSDDDRLRIEFRHPFDIPSYELFLRCKRLPEYQIETDAETGLACAITTSARFAPLLGANYTASQQARLPFPEFLFEHQTEILKLALDAKRYAVWSDCGTGKGQPWGSRILTPTGWVKIEELKVGMQVIASDGKACKVTGVYPKGEQSTYRVHFSDKSSFVVDEDHLHIVRTNNDRQRGNPWRVLSTRELLASKLRYGKNGKSRNYDIPLCAPIDFKSSSLPIHPYLLGVLLGDGCIRQSVCFTNPDVEIAEKVKGFLPEGFSLGLKTGSDKDYRITYEKHGRNPLISALRELGLMGGFSYEKHIPQIYQFASIQDRVELLRGLMDTDGHVDDSCFYYTTSAQLADGVVALVRSLGGAPTVNLKKSPTYTHKGEERHGRDCFVVTFSLKTFNPFYLQRKAAKWNSNPRDNGRWIDRIEYEKQQPTICISVDSSDQSYVTENYIVTHNTLIELEFARQIVHVTGGRVLILTLNEIVEQIIDEARRFYGDSLQIVRLNTRAEMRAWCAGKGEGQIAITNYEKMNPDDSGQDVTEFRHLAGLILDESSRLKAGGGKQKWALIKSSKGIPYKLSCTATPAPNDVMEFASQASFLERMRSENEIIWTFFARDPITQEWTVKRHARTAFFEWMAAWSIYLRDPRRYGWSSSIVLPPEPEILKHPILPMQTQLDAAQVYNTDSTGQLSLLPTQAQGVVGRSKLSQIGKGFAYQKDKSAVRIDSLKPDVVARLIQAEYAMGLQVLVWTVFDEESEIILEALRDLDIDTADFAVLSGSTPKPKRQPILNAFRQGKLPVLISKAKLLGYGMNFQNCGSMIFSGWNDSFEEFYQAVRRAVRYGQQRAVRIHLPYIEELEGAQLENLLRKADQFEELVAEQERSYIAAMNRLHLLQEAL